MESMAGLKTSVAGVINSFLLKEKTLLWSDTKISTQLINSLYYMTDVIKNKGGLKRIAIGADKDLIVFMHEDYFLGVITTPSVNLPMLALYANKIFQNVEKPSEEENLGIKVEVREPNLFDKSNPTLPPHILARLGLRKKGDVTLTTTDKKSFVVTVEELTDKRWDGYEVIMMNTAARQKLGVTIGSYIYVAKRG